MHPPASLNPKKRSEANTERERGRESRVEASVLTSQAHLLENGLDADAALFGNQADQAGADVADFVVGVEVVDVGFYCFVWGRGPAFGGVGVNSE